jgi:hypothetical protein
MPSETVNEATRQEWRDLGFFYERNDERKEWRLIGSHSGLLRFCDLLINYAANSLNEAQSEHDHYGPYMYLKVMTWTEPGMDGNAIYGTLQDLRRLAGIIEGKLQDTRTGSVLRIQKEFADSCEYCLVLSVRDEGFDPASADSELLKGAG